MFRKTIVAVGVALVAVGAAPTGAQALTVTHTTSSFSSTTRWPCPGRNPVEQFTLTFHDTTFERHGARLRAVSHATWRGWITNRTTGALVRDASNWTEIFTFGPNGHKVIRHVTVGAVWRLTIPGQGIVLQQTGRDVIDPDGETSTPNAGFIDVSAMCPFV